MLPSISIERKTRKAEGLTCLWFIRTVKSLTSVRQLQEQALHCPIQSLTRFSIHKSGDRWTEQPNCLLNIRLGKNCMNRLSRHIVVFNIAGRSQQYNHVKEENFNSCCFHSPWQQRRKESGRRWESIMWQWCHGSTGSDQGHMSYGVPSLSSVHCILYIRIWTFRLTVSGDTCDAYSTNHVQYMTNPRHINKNKLWTIRSELSPGSLQNTTLTQDNSKLPSGSVILLFCCDRSQVNYHRGAECIRSLAVEQVFGGP